MIGTRYKCDCDAPITDWYGYSRPHTLNDPPICDDCGAIQVFDCYFILQSTLQTAYNKLRTDFPTFIAKQAICLARMNLEQERISQDWLDRADELREPEPESTWVFDGFEFTAKIEYDACPDYSLYGQFINTWEPGAYDRAEGEAGWNTKEYQYILPECDIAKEREANKKLHYGKAEADLMARRIWKDQRDAIKRIASNDLQFFSLVVESKHAASGVDLDGDSLWGIEIDSTMNYQCITQYLASILEEVASNARRRALARLTEVKNELCSFVKD